jgi:probable H4MPT-linked C1 transfer pathway protein
MSGVLGLDIGGANLKAAHTAGVARSVPFALWKDPAGLADRLRTLLAEFPSPARLAVTMTAELCDCFASKRQGVEHVLAAVETLGGATIRVWTNEGVFADLKEARRVPLKVASANWLAQATLVARRLSSAQALLIDVGTTTTDIVPLDGGQAVPRGRTDPERMRCGELVYRGWRRTPLCALVEGSAAELFATMHDVYLALGRVAEDPGDRDSADGQPATREAAWRRLARMGCADLETSTPEERAALAHLAHERLLEQVAHGVRQVVARLRGPVECVVASGSGAFLVPEVLARMDLAAAIIDYADLAPDMSAVACAHAVAVLCQEQDGP